MERSNAERFFFEQEEFMPTLGSVVPVLRKSGSSDIASPPAGWIGSKLGLKGDLVTLDANGRVDQAVAVNVAITSGSPRIAYLSQNVAASVAQNTAVAIEKFDDDTLISLPVSNTSDSAAIPTTLAQVGKQYQLRRTNTTGIYVIDTLLTATPVVEVVGIDPRYPVGENGGLLICRVLAGARLA